MTGTIHLGGGGDSIDEAPLWRVMLKGKRRVLYWPFALPPARIGEIEGWLAGAFAGLGVDTELETWTDLAQHHPDEMGDVDLLFVGGGNTFRLLDRVRSAGFEQAVRDFVARGGDSTAAVPARSSRARTSASPWDWTRTRSDSPTSPGSVSSATSWCCRTTTARKRWRHASRAAARGGLLSVCRNAPGWQCGAGTRRSSVTSP